MICKENRTAIVNQSKRGNDHKMVKIIVGFSDQDEVHRWLKSDISSVIAFWGMFSILFLAAILYLYVFPVMQFNFSFGLNSSQKMYSSLFPIAVNCYHFEMYLRVTVKYLCVFKVRLKESTFFTAMHS